MVPAGPSRDLAAAQRVPPSPACIPLTDTVTESAIPTKPSLRHPPSLMTNDSESPSRERGQRGGESPGRRLVHLRMSENSDRSSSLSPPREVPWAPRATAAPCTWALGWPRLPRSPLALRPVSLALDSAAWWPASPWLVLEPLALSPGGSCCLGAAVGGLCTAEVQKLRMEQRLPQFCSHWVCTLRVMASLMSSPQVSSRFTRSMYGLEGGRGQREVLSTDLAPYGPRGGKGTGGEPRVRLSGTASTFPVFRGARTRQGGLGQRPP